MSEFVVKNRDGIGVYPGGMVTEFRGKPGIFERVTRGPGIGKSARVIVDGREYYATVWGLTVEDQPAEEARSPKAEANTPGRESP